MPEGVSKVRGEGELNALKLYLRLERIFGSDVGIPTGLARRRGGLRRRTFYHYMQMLERAGIVEWCRGSLDYKTRKRREGSLTLRSLDKVDREKALRLGLRALKALREKRRGQV